MNRAGQNTRDSPTRSTRGRISSARFNFFMSWAGSLARYFNEPAQASSRAAHELKWAEAYQLTTMNPEDNDANLEIYTYSIDM